MARLANFGLPEFDSSPLVCYTLFTIEYRYVRGAPKPGREGHIPKGEAGQSPALSRNCSNGGQTVRWSQSTHLYRRAHKPSRKGGGAWRVLWHRRPFPDRRDGEGLFVCIL